MVHYPQVFWGWGLRVAGINEEVEKCPPLFLLKILSIFTSAELNSFLFSFLQVDFICSVYYIMYQRIR